MCDAALICGWYGGGFSIVLFRVSTDIHFYLKCV